MSTDLQWLLLRVSTTIQLTNDTQTTLETELQLLPREKGPRGPHILHRTRMSTGFVPRTIIRRVLRHRVTSAIFIHTSTRVFPIPRQGRFSDTDTIDPNDVLQTIDIQDSPSGIQVTINKSKATLHQVRAARMTFTIRNRSGGRRALGVVAGLAKKGYRPDLRAVSTFLCSSTLFFSLGCGELRKRTLVRTHWIAPHTV